MSQPKLQTVSGIVLKKQSFFEKDCLIELLTKDHGKKKIIAKQALSKSCKFGGLIEPTQVIECQLYQGKTFQLLTQCQLIHTYPHLHTHFNALSLACYCLDIIRKSTQFDLPSSELYHLLQQTLDQIHATSCYDTIKTQFQSQLLHVEGLLQENTETLSDHQFQSIFANYTNHTIKPPVLI